MNDYLFRISKQVNLLKKIQFQITVSSNQMNERYVIYLCFSYVDKINIA